MKKLLFIFCLATASAALAADKPVSVPAATAVKGEVLEVQDAAGYTYLRLKTKDGETWAAVSTAPVKVGAQVALGNVMAMNNFESKALKKTFPTILFGSLAGTGVAGSAPLGHGAPAPAAVAGTIKVAKATGPDARTVADILTMGTSLKDKLVSVRGKVVKFNGGIMGRNWVHLQDGSGTAPNNDLLVTTTQVTNVGDVVTAKGLVRTEKDFGSGYVYKVMVEDATLKP